MHSTNQQEGTPALTATEAVVALLQQGDTVRFTAEGHSMHPLIPFGATVVVRPFSSADARRGAILLFPHGKRLVLHRLIRIDKHSGTALFSGDMNQQGAEAVALTSILGTATGVRLPDGRERALHTRVVRWAGLLRHHVRPLRRVISRLAERMRLVY